MAFVLVRQNESPESFIRRFKRAVEKAGIISDMRKHESYEKPSERKKKKHQEAIKLKRKQQRWNR